VLTEIEALNRNLIAQKKFDEAERLLDEALTPSFIQQSSSVKLLALRIDLRGRRGHLKEAASDATLALTHEPKSNERCHVLAALLAKIGDRAGYEDLCEEFFTIFRNTTNIYIADQLAKTCLLIPSGRVNLKEIDGLADMAVTSGTGDQFSMPFFQVCKALSQYRQGNFAEAIAWAEKPLQSSSRYSHAHACAVLAMAHWRLGEKVEARAMFQKGNVLSPAVIPARDAEDPGNAWLAWLYARISLDEAAILIDAEK
jgi:Tfp pilus assembly protein PilF